jgi:hypothetical protein
MQERGLHRVQPVAAGKALNRGDRLVLAAGSQRQAGQYAPAIDTHRACTTSTAVAPLLGAGQPHLPAQRIEQRRASVNRQRNGIAIDPQDKLDASR